VRSVGPELFQPDISLLLCGGGGGAGTQPLDMEAFLTSPSGKMDACEIRDTPGHKYDIRFVPEEEGLHHVSIKYKGIHISGRFNSRM